MARWFTRTRATWQAREQTGYDLTQFTIDWDKRQAICAQGQRSTYWYPCYDRRGLEGFVIVFRRATCLACPARNQCTRSSTQGRHLQIRPRPQHEALQQLRASQTTEAFKRRYTRAWALKAHSRKPLAPSAYDAVAIVAWLHLPQTGRPSRPGGLAARTGC